ncbi:MAG: GNAT family N-acetyltransferase [Protaetiibacter sp.]
MTSFARPRPITPHDDVSPFGCGQPSLDSWLHLRAIKNEVSGFSRTFVSIERDSGLIAGYYCLSASSLAREDASGALARNAPDPIPVLLIGRLAVDARFQRLGVGSSLLQDAVLKSIEASRLIGSRAILVDALDDDAVAFYSRAGFALVPRSSRVMYLLMKDVEATVIGG